MSRERSISPLTEDDHRLIAAIERDLERLLSAEPSPDFARRVRERVAAGGVGGTQRWRYWVTAAAIAIAAGGTLLNRGEHPPPVIPVVKTGPSEIAAASPGDARPRSAVGHAVSAARVPWRATTKLPPGAKGGELEVLVPNDRRVALERFLDMVNAGVVDERVFPLASVGAAHEVVAQAVAPIDVEGLQVRPLPGFEARSDADTGPDRSSDSSTNQGEARDEDR